MDKFDFCKPSRILHKHSDWLIITQTRDIKCTAVITVVHIVHAENFKECKFCITNYTTSYVWPKRWTHT